MPNKRFRNIAEKHEKAGKISAKEGFSTSSKGSKALAVFFDLDGTLMDTSGLAAKERMAAVRAMIGSGLHAESERKAYEKLLDIIKRHGSNHQFHLNRLCRHFNGKDVPEIITAGIIAYHDVKARQIKPTAGTIELLRWLRDEKKARLALITNGLAIKQWEKIIRLGIREHFDVVLVSGNPDTGRPKLGMIRKAMKMLSVKPSRCIFVGDRLGSDIASANKAGVVSVLYAKKDAEVVRWADDFQKPDLVVRKLTDIRKALQIEIGK